VIAFILRRILYIIPVLLGVLAITLTLFFVVAEDPVLQYAGQNPTAEQLRALRTEYELDVPAFFSPSWLAGEDIIETRRHARLEEFISRVVAAHQEYVDAEAARMREAGASAEQVAQFRRDADDALDRFRRTWDREADLEGAAEAINEDLRELIPGTERSISFEDIALSPQEQAEVAQRSIWDAQFFRVLRLVEIGEASIVIQTATPHRGAAFDACRYLIDRIKHELPIWTLIRDKAPRTLAVTIPMFLIGLAIELTLALFAASRRGRPIDVGITIFAVLAMSIPFLSYVIFGQWLAAETRIVPVSGWAPLPGGVRYLVFPVAVGVIAGLGSAVRFYRAVLLEEMERDYVRTARAKGVKRNDVLFIHVLRNAGIPIVTRLSVIVPFLITGSLLIETTFEIPGLGDLMLSAIRARDFWVVMPLTYLLAVVYSVVVLLTDIVYAVIDPRVRVGS